MTNPENETIVIHTFTVVPPLSAEEFERLYRFVRKNKMELVMWSDTEDGHDVTFLIVPDRAWLVEKELKRMGRQFHEPPAVRFDSTTG